MIFAPKTVVLIANVQNTLVWSGTDFQKTLGYAHPEKPLEFVFTCQNPTTQVVYVAISFQTLNVTYNINDRKTIAGIPAGGTLRISSNSARELGSLGPDLVSITLYFLGAAAGTITVSAEAFDGTTGFTSGGSNQLFGTDTRTLLDYIPLAFSQGFTPAFGTAVNTIYTVPVGKRAYIDYIQLTAFWTPSFDVTTQIAIGVNSPSIGVYQICILNSSHIETKSLIVQPTTILLNETDALQYAITNNRANTSPDDLVSYNILGREVF